MSCAHASPTSAWDTQLRLVKCRGRCIAVAACASPLFFVFATSLSLLMRCPSTLPLQLVACARVLPSACATPLRLYLCCGLSFAAVLCPPFWLSRLCRLCLCVTLVLCPRGKWLALALCCQLTFSPSWLCHRCLGDALVLRHCFKWLALALHCQLAFFAVAALLLLCVRCPHASPLQQMGHSCALLTAHILCPCGFAVSARALPSWQIALARALPSACILRPSGFAVAARALRSFFAVIANGLRSRFAISLHPLPLKLCLHCAGVALFLRLCGKWLVLALCS